MSELNYASALAALDNDFAQANAPPATAVCRWGGITPSSRRQRSCPATAAGCR